MNIRHSNSILIVTPFFRPNVGGVETHLTDLVNYLLNNGYKVFVITYQPLTTNVRALRTEKQGNLEIHRVEWFGQNLFNKVAPYMPLNFAYLFPGLFLYALFFLLRRGKEVGVIHGHGLASAAVIAPMARIFRKRSVLSLHTIYRFKERRSFSSILKPIFLQIDRILICSEGGKEDLVAMGISPSKVGVFRYWINQSIFKPMDKFSCKKALKLNNRFVALFVGRLIAEKGTNEVLEATSTLKDEATFLIIGSGPLASKIQSMAKLQPNLFFAGSVKNENLPLYYNAADILVWGQADYDYINRVCIEAISCKLPIIVPNEQKVFQVTRKVNPKILDPSIGVFIEPSSQALCAQLKYFKENPQELELLASGCQEYAVKHFSEKNAKVIEDAYKSS